MLAGWWTILLADALAQDAPVRVAVAGDPRVAPTPPEADPADPVGVSAATSVVTTAPAPMAPGDWAAPLAANLVALAQRTVWVRRTQPPTSRPLDSITVDPRDPLLWLVIDDDGAVFRSPDAGVSWTRVLDGRGAAAADDGVDPERVLLDAETARTEELESTDVEADLAGGADTTTLDATAVDATEQALREAADRAASRAEQEGEGIAVATPGRVWFDPAWPQVVFVGRPDGVWHSEDGGLSWWIADDQLGATEFYRWGDILVLGGASGVRASADGARSFIDLESATGGATVYQFVAIGDVLYAATGGGLYASPDGLRWSRVGAAGDDPVLAVVPDPSWAGGFWLAGPNGLRRSDDGGRTFFSAGTQPMRGLRRILPLPGVGHLLAISSDGVWESTDGGVRWLFASRLLTEPDVRDVALLDDHAVVATADGVWQMVDAVSIPEAAAPDRRGFDLSTAVELSLHRTGLSADTLGLVQKTAVLPFVPQLQIDAGWALYRGRAAEYLLLETTEDAGVDWSARMQLCWGGCGTTLYSGGDVDTSDYLQELVDSGQVSVINGEVYDEGNVAAAAANVAEAVTRYRYTVAQQVSEAWITRRRLMSEHALLAERPLSEQVNHLLKVQELDAHLDAFTEGAWTSSLLHPPETP